MESPLDKIESFQGEERRCVSVFPEVPFLPKGPSQSPIVLKSPARNAQNVWKETDDAYVFKLDLSVVKEHEVKLEIEDNRVMCISPDKIRAEREERTDIWSLVRGNFRKFYWRIVLPDDADVDKVMAEMNNGELIIIVPKYQFRKPMLRVVQIYRR